MLVLVVCLPFRRGPERARSEALVCDTQVLANTHILIHVLPLVESLHPTEVSIK